MVPRMKLARATVRGDTKTACGKSHNSARSPVSAKPAGNDGLTHEAASPVGQVNGTDGPPADETQQGATDFQRDRKGTKRAPLSSVSELRSSTYHRGVSKRTITPKQSR